MVYSVISDLEIRSITKSESNLSLEDRRKLYSAVAEVGADFKDVFSREFRSGVGNAMVLPDGRMLISDRIVQSLDPEELVAVVRHEAEHLKWHRIRAIIALISAPISTVVNLAFVGFMLDSKQVADAFQHLSIGAFPALIGSICVGVNALNALASTTLGFFSRRGEYKADLGAARKGSAEPLISALTKIDEVNEHRARRRYASRGLIKRLELSHPSTEKRIQNIKEHMA